jgi:MFS family permease
MSEQEIGTIFFSGTIASIVMLVILFIHSDVVGRIFYVLLFGSLIVLAGIMVALFPPTPILIVCVIMFLKASGRSKWTFGKIFTIERFKKQKGLSYGIFGASLVSGVMLGNLVAGVLVDFFKFKVSFMVSSVVGMFSLVPILFIKRRKIKLSKFSFIPKISGPFVGLTLHRFLMSIGLNVLVSFALPLYLNKILFLPYVVIGVVLMIRNVGNVIGFLSGKLSDKFDFRKVGCLALSISSIFILLMIFTKNLFLVTILLFLSQLAIGIYATTLPHFFERASTQLGRDISIIESVGIALGGSIGSWLAGILIQSFDYSSVFIANFILSIISLMPLYVFIRR